MNKQTKVKHSIMLSSTLLVANRSFVHHQRALSGIWLTISKREEGLKLNVALKFFLFSTREGKATQRKPSIKNPGFKSPIFPLRVQPSPEQDRIYGATEVRCNVPPAASVSQNTYPDLAVRDKQCDSTLAV